MTSLLTHSLQVGFLFLRYVAEPRTLWSWVEEFLQDREARWVVRWMRLHSCWDSHMRSPLALVVQEFAPSADERKKVTMGLFVRELLLDQFYFETIFPRIPEGISRTIKDSLARMGCATVALGCGGIGGTRRQGGGAADEGPSRRPPSVKAALSVSLSQRAPHVAGVRETGRGFANVDPSKHGAGGGGDGGGRGGEHVHHNRGAPGRGPPPGAPPPGQPPWEREREHDHRRQEHYRHGRQSRSRSRSRSRERRHRSHSRERHRSHHRSRSRDRDRDRERDRHYRRSRSRSGERGRRGRGEGREEPQQGPDPGRSAHDVFRALPPPLMTTTTALKDKY